MRARTAQAIMKIKVTVTETSQILKGMTFSMAGTTSVSDIAKARIFYSGATPYFSPNAEQANRRAIPVLNTISKGAKTFQFEGSHALSAGDQLLLAVRGPQPPRARVEPRWTPPARAWPCWRTPM